MKSNKSAVIRNIQIIFILIPFVALILFATITGGITENQIESNKIKVINSSIPSWTLVKLSGTEANYKFYVLNGSDKKTHLMWATNTNDGAKNIYNCEGTIIKNDKNKDLTAS